MSDSTTTTSGGVGGQKLALPRQQQKSRQLQEERLRNLLSSIGHLSVHGEVPVYAFGTLISTAPPQAIAEHLHERWLADPNFSRIAPKIVLQMSGNVTVCSQLLSFALRDFNTRHDIRAQSRGMFRNFARTLVELYPVYRKIDKCLSACLLEPLFQCLQMLAEEDPDDRDLHCLAHIIVDSGQQLSQLNAPECNRIVLSCRRWLCSNRVPLEEETRRLLMNAIDLWTYSWDRNLFPDCLRRFYEDIEEEQKRKKAQREELAYSSALDRQLSHIPSYSSQQMTDSASSSLPSSALGLDTQTTLTTKSQPQSRASMATLAFFPAASSASLIEQPHHHQQQSHQLLSVSSSLPLNGHSSRQHQRHHQNGTKNGDDKFKSSKKLSLSDRCRPRAVTKVGQGQQRQAATGGDLSDEDEQDREQELEEEEKDKESAV